jgi:hypothetical protein
MTQQHQPSSIEGEPNNGGSFWSSRIVAPLLIDREPTSLSAMAGACIAVIGLSAALCAYYGSAAAWVVFAIIALFFGALGLSLRSAGRIARRAEKAAARSADQHPGSVQPGASS